MSYEFGSTSLVPQQISKHFTLSDLTITSLAGNNTPTGEALSNLKKLGAVLDILYDELGPFKVISAYRSPTIQAALKSGAGGSASASQAATYSLHSLGMAADIVPSKGTANDFFTRIAESPRLKAMLGEIAIKTNGPYLGPAQTLHISLPTSTKQGVLMYVNSAGQYIRMASADVGAFLSKYRKPLLIAGGIFVPFASAIALFLWLRSRRKK